ncbi:MAG: putative zinc-binding protein [Candidatus Hydrogenedentes bacterium]|nr:putative zinc-binding protein [Candidatus Hydrogenedentota bacterium]
MNNASGETAKPLVFACAGCSDVGRLAYDVARELDRRGIAEMSCLAGIAAGKPAFLRKLRGRHLWLVDGCPIECALATFANAGHAIARHIRLADYGFKKNVPIQGWVNIDELIGLVLDAAGRAIT